MKVLVTDGSYNQTLAIVRTLGKRGHKVSVLSIIPSLHHSIIPSLHYVTSSLSKYCSQSFVLPSAKAKVGNPESIRDSLLSILKNNKFDLLIPVGSNSVRLVSAYRKELDELVKFELPAPEKIFFALNKKHTYKLAEKLGIPVPLTIYPSTLDEVGASSTCDYIGAGFKPTLTYPVVIKALEDTGTHIIDYVNDREQLLPKYKQICIKYNLKAPKLPMIQERIKGDGYGFFALYQDGEMKRSFMHHRIREYPVQGGASSCAESFWDPRLKEHSKKLLDELGWHGVCMVEFKKDKDNYKLMELNPKFWGSLDLAICSGVDFPALLCEMAEGRKISYSEDYELGVKYHWPLSDDFMHIIEKPKDIPQFIRDCLTAKSNISYNDFLPNLWEFKETISQLIRNIIFTLCCHKSPPSGRQGPLTLP